MQLPSTENMLADQDGDLKWRMTDLAMPKRYGHVLASMQWDYNDMLARLAGFSPIPRVVQKLYDRVHDCRIHDLVHYKLHEFRLINGTEFKELPRNETNLK